MRNNQPDPRQSPERLALGKALRDVRDHAGLTTRQVSGFSSGHISSVENGRVLPSERLVRSYVELGGDAGRLLGLFDRARSATRVRLDPTASDQLSDPRSDPHLLRRGYVVDRVSDGYRFGAQHQLLDMQHRALIHPVDDAARYFPFRYSYNDDPRPGVASVKTAPGIDAVHVEEDDVGTLYAVLDFADAPRTDGGLFDLRWTITVRSSRPSRPIVLGGTSTRLPAARVTVGFDPVAEPTSIWWFRDFDERAGLADNAIRTRHAVTRDETGHYTYELSDLDKEWWGLAWQWDH